MTWALSSLFSSTRLVSTCIEEVQIFSLEQQGNFSKSSQDVDMLEDLNEYLGMEKSKFKFLKKEFVSLQNNYDVLKDEHEKILLYIHLAHLAYPSTHHMKVHNHRLPSYYLLP